MKILHILKRILFIILYAILGFIFISIFMLFFMIANTPSTKITNYTKDDTLRLLNKNILVNNDEISNVIFSQGNYGTFQGDGGYNIVVELSDIGMNRILSNKTYIGELEYKDISSLSKCGGTDYTDLKNPKEIYTKSDYKTQKFYYVKKERDLNNRYSNDDGAITIYVDKENKLLYLCTFR